MKKKIISLCLVAIVAVMAIAGASLAYLTDTDKADNVFVTGNVKIDLIENFGDNDPSTPEKLLPAIGSAQQGTLKNGITKEVSVKNLGSEEAYVRVHIAIPSILDDGADTFDANNNVLHFNYPKENVGAGLWDWSKAADDDKYAGDWNYYEKVIDGVKYNVYVVTYATALKTNEETPLAMDMVYLDSKVTNEDLAQITEALGANWHILVVAEGVQAAGFDNAYDALNTAFGVPGAYNVDFSGAEKQ